MQVEDSRSTALSSLTRPSIHMHVRPMKIVVLDGYTLNPGDNPWDDLARLGDLVVYDRSDAADVVPRAADAHIVLTNKTPLSRTTLEQLPELRFIGVLATGYNIVDVEAARQRGIPVANVPEYGTDSVAQHTFALLLELCHHVGRHDAAVKAGRWTRSKDFCFWDRPPIELTGLTIGIIGFGRIGKRVGTLAHAFGMKVVAAVGRRHSTPAYEPFAWLETNELFSSADIVTLHCPLTPDNERFVNGALLARMKPSALLLNTARGPLVDEQALADALNDNRIAGAAVDVVSTEPIRAGNPLLTARNCLITPHMAWGSLAARKRLMAATVSNVAGFLRGQPQNVVKE
jgi:glycerate dehydrogenase